MQEAGKEIPYRLNASYCEYLSEPSHYLRRLEQGGTAQGKGPADKGKWKRQFKEARVITTGNVRKSIPEFFLLIEYDDNSGQG